MEFSFETIINTIFYIGAIQGVILTVFLFSVKNNKLSNRLLGILTFLWAVLFVVFALQSHGLYIEYPHLLITFVHLLLAWFPLFYLSVKYLISSHQKFQKTDYLHFLPVLFNILLYSWFYFKTGEEKLVIVRANEGFYYIANFITEEILTIQGIVYTILALLLIQNYKKSIVDYQSTIDIKVLNGFRNGIILAMIAWSAGIVGSHLERFNIDLDVDLFLFVYLTFVVIIYYLSVLAIRSPEVFKLTSSEIRSSTLRKGLETDSKKQEQTEKLSVDSSKHFVDQKSEQDIRLKQTLIELMQEDKPYLNPDLSLQDMAKKLDVSRHRLSALINQQQQMNFYEFVNNYRVEEVKRLMDEPGNKSRKNYDLAFDAGFNSRASFYRIFKQFTEQTPSEYRG
jgi:AraC-like DNA-binding protein